MKTLALVAMALIGCGGTPEEIVETVTASTVRLCRSEKESCLVRQTGAVFSFSCVGEETDGQAPWSEAAPAEAYDWVSLEGVAWHCSAKVKLGN